MNAEKPDSLKAYQFSIIIASFVIIIAGLKTASSLFIPFLLATFISIIATPPFLWLQKNKVPKGISLLLIIVMFLLVIFVIALLIGTSINDFTTKIPYYETRLQSQIDGLLNWLQENNITKEPIKLNEVIKPAAILSIVGNALNEISGIFANGFLILLTIIFMMLEVSSLPLKLKNIFKEPEKSIGRVQSILDKINKYIFIKTWISLVTGLLATILCFIIGVDYPFLWGMFAFILNYIPTIGPLIALIPPVLLTVVQFGLFEALIVLIGFILINTVMGNIVEPKVMGRGLGLSTLVVFLSLIFWGWVLGPVGMLLSVPITIAIQIILDSSDETKWIAILLGSEKTK